MRHQKSGRKLNRTSAHRKAMFRNMVSSLILHERIQTTEAKAKALRPVVEKLVTLAKKAKQEEFKDIVKSVVEADPMFDARWTSGDASSTPAKTTPAAERNLSQSRA